MSWNGVIPAWIWHSIANKEEAMMLCAFPDEYASGWNRAVPGHVAEYHRSTNYEKWYRRN